MIRERTVFILGAGASVDYGFPVGRDLKTRVEDLLRETVDTEKLWAELWPDRGQRLEVRSALRESQQPSVDLFLERRYQNDNDETRRERFMQIGKLAIAMALIEKEQPKFLMSDPLRKKWFEQLWPYIDADPSAFGGNQIGFITFNYDRSLEYLIYNALRANYPKFSQNDVVRGISSIPIVHMYGLLSPPLWSSAEGRDYTNRGSSDDIRKAASGIHLAHERKAYASVDRVVDDILRRAEKVAFLGFGYNSVNVDRLNTRQRCEDTPKYGTVFGLVPREQAAVSGMISENSLIVYLGDETDDVLACLRKLDILPPIL